MPYAGQKKKKKTNFRSIRLSRQTVSATKDIFAQKFLSTRIITMLNERRKKCITFGIHRVQPVRVRRRPVGTHRENSTGKEIEWDEIEKKKQLH
jgi:hypothetical protein